MRDVQNAMSAVTSIAVLAAFAVLALWFLKKASGMGWKLMAPLLILGVLVVTIATESGVAPYGELLDKSGREQALQVPKLSGIVAQMPTAQVVLIGLVAVLWIGGGNALFIWQRRRSGLSWRDSINPFGPMFRDFDQKAWTLFGLLLFATLVLMSAAVSMTEDLPSGDHQGRLFESQPMQEQADASTDRLRDLELRSRLGGKQ